METKDDLTLIELAKQGNRNAENALLLRYSYYVDAIARPMFLVGGDKDDLVQEGLLGLDRAIKTYDLNKKANFKTYASYCIKNAMLDLIKKSVRADNIFVESLSDGENQQKMEEIPSMVLSPEEQLLQKEANELFFEGLKEILGDTDANIIKMYLSAMTYKEISETLGITPKKVDNAIYSAKHKLEKVMSKLKTEK